MSAVAHPAGRSRPDSRVRSWARTHPVAAFFAGAYLWSWGWWSIPAAGAPDAVGIPALFLGVFGPLAAAAAMTRILGGSPRAWLRGIVHERPGGRWVAGVIAFPVALIGLTVLELSLLGVELDVSLLGPGLVAYLPTLLFCFLLNGGPEEPGWRGFALPRLQQRFTPVKATLLLGVVWALWHLPLLLAEDGNDHGVSSEALVALLLWTMIGIAAGYAVLYTFVYNRTGSVLLCMLLHAAINTSNGVFLLVPEAEQEGWTYATISLCLTGTLLLITLTLIAATRGRLGKTESG